MFKKIILILVFIFTLLFIPTMIIIINSHTTCPEFESDSHRELGISVCEGRYGFRYSILILTTLICIASGYYLFRRKKEQINSDSQNITDKDQNGITKSQTNVDSIDSKLQKLKSMLDKELITEEEFNAKKQKLIDEM